MASSEQDSNLFQRFGDFPDWGDSGGSQDIPFLDLASDTPLELPDAPPEAASRDVEGPMPPPGLSSGQVWLNGDVLMCACPDCGAPMSIRFWLMIADCWKCGTSIELSQEQEREARRLLAERDASPLSQPTPAVADKPRQAAASQKSSTPQAEKETPPAQPASQAPPPPAPPPQPRTKKPAEPRSRPARPSPQAGRQPRTAAQARLQARLQRSAQATGVTALMNDLFGCTPAWVVSLILHIVLLTLLALFSLSSQDDGPYITLSTTVSKDVREGGDTVVIDPLNELQFDLPVPQDVDLTDSSQREAVVRANQDAIELQLDP